MARRSLKELLEAEHEYSEKLWYLRCHLPMRKDVNDGKEVVNPEIWEEALKAAEGIEKEYGTDWFPKNDFELAIMWGKLAALRWAIGTEWDFFDL